VACDRHRRAYGLRPKARRGAQGPATDSVMMIPP
jgi:hypothetical protein